MIFIEERLLDTVAYGSQFGHSYKTTIESLRSGHEGRNAEWSLPLGKYSVIYKNIESSDHEAVVKAHHACMGSLFGFRLKDWLNYSVTGEVIGTGDGSSQEFQLVKNYTFGSGAGAITRAKEIYKPVANTVDVLSNGVSIGFTLDETTGIVTCTAPLGEEVTWTGEYDIPVRFLEDEIMFSVIASQGALQHILESDVDLVEIRV